MSIFIENIRKSYDELQVLKGITLSIAEGEVVAIVGPSGAGKSTLLHIMGTIDKPDSGTVQLLNQNVLKLPEKKLADFRNKNIGFVFQFHHLLPEFTALENTIIPALIQGVKEDVAQKKAKEWFEYLNLNHRLHHKPSELSGGEQQRVAVARALINNPPLLLADEPSGNLDSANASELHQLFFDLRNKFNKTVVIVTHNNELAQMADRKVVIRDGQIDN
ncbi:MAG: Lipoprotein-releasing system ATP-binding protein LolD [Bacteroidetes bacterium ADurb.Bin141]|nr:MAG: Lipoprotein-releasing system ATP-binding protein LolD [Bacteroidetes bacterium ADurb.Bin141]